MDVYVYNLATMDDAHCAIFTSTPREAVIAMYAISRGDWNTWDYGKYESLVVEGSATVACGDYAAMQLIGSELVIS